MKKHLFILSAIMLLTAWMAQAATPLGFKVADVTITSDNYNQPITSEFITAYVDTLPFSVTYNHSTATLTLKNVKIKRTGSYNRAILNESCTNLIIAFEGQNLLEAFDSSPVRLNANTTIKGLDDEATMHIYGGSQDALTIGDGATLTIKDANLYCNNNSNKTYSSGLVGATGNEKVKIINSDVTLSGNNGGYGLKNIGSLNVQSSNLGLHGGGGYEGSPALNLKAFSYSGDQFHLLGDTGYDVVFSPTEKNFMVGSTQTVQTAGVIVAKAIDYLNDRDAFPDVNFAQAISDNTRYYTYWEARVMRRYILLPFRTDPGTGNHYAIFEANDRNISSLKGVEYITGFEDVNLANNNLTTADLSQSPNLKTLDISNNRLTSLNLTNCNKLRELDCSDNRLTSLHLSHCQPMRKLYCQNNQIASLSLPQDDLSFDKLVCSNNKIPALDIYGLKNLTYLDCSHNELEGNLAVYGIYLDSLNCSFNKITRIDNLINCGHVKTLRCNDNLIERLDMSNMIRLETFDCQNNKFTTLNLKWCSNLNGTVNAYGNNINGSGLDNLIANLPALNNHRLNLVDHNNANEGNACTAAQVAAAKEQGWTLCHRWNSDTWDNTDECLNYDVYIAGKRLCSHLASNANGAIDGVSGTWRYNDNAHMILLQDATIAGGNHAGIDSYNDLVINVVGDNTVTSNASVGIVLRGNDNRITGFNATGTHNLTVTGNARGIYVRGDNLLLDGALQLDAESRVYGLLGNNNTTVTVGHENTVVRTKGTAGNAMRSVSSLILNDGLAITQPVGTTFSPGVGFLNNNSEVVNEWVTISQPFTEYPIEVAGIPVTSRNADAITGEGISGTVTYSPDNNVLTLTDATLTYAGTGINVGSTLPGLKIKLNGTNTIKVTKNNQTAVYFQNCDGAVVEGGSLNIDCNSMAFYLRSGSGTGDHRMTIKDCDIDVTNGGCISGDENLTIANSMIHLTNGYISTGYDLKLVGCEINRPVGGHVSRGSVCAQGSDDYFTGQIVIMPTTGLRGDVNGDSKVDVEDVNAVINIILELKLASDYSGEPDVTGDNKVDVEDVNAIINIILTN